MNSVCLPIIVYYFTVEPPIKDPLLRGGQPPNKRHDYSGRISYSCSSFLTSSLSTGTSNKGLSGKGEPSNKDAFPIAVVHF